MIYVRFGYILNVINAATYMLQNDETKWFCIECSNVSVLLPRQSWVFLLNSTNQLDDAMNSSDLSILITYYTIDKFNKNFMSNSFSGTDLLHLNKSSLPYNYEQLHTLSWHWHNIYHKQYWKQVKKLWITLIRVWLTSSDS